jgi:hypothetical protein
VEGSSANPHDIGVWYDPAALKWTIFNQDVAAMPVGSRFFWCEFCGLPPGAAGTNFHEATAGNTIGTTTYPSFANDPRRWMLVTQAFNVTGDTDVRNPHPIGVWWDDLLDGWTIANQDAVSIPLGAQFSFLTTALIDAHGFENGSTAGWAAFVP